MEGFRDHVVLNFHGKETAFAMCKTLTNLFQSRSDARNLALRDKLRNIRMGKNETVVQYLSRFTQVRDKLRGVGENVPSYELVSLAFLGLPKSWHNYQDLVN